MSSPYIIWTMQRTGGTTLAQVLATLSEYQGVQHEPFNAERMFGAITTAFAADGDIDALKSKLEQALADKPVIKHCYELLPPEQNAALMQVSTASGYKHIILDRRAEADRILSLELARATGAWGGSEAKEILGKIARGGAPLPELNRTRALHHLGQCRLRRGEMLAELGSRGIEPFVVYFEDIYSDFEAGKRLILRILAFLGIDPNAKAGADKMIDDALTNNGQNSASVLNTLSSVVMLRDDLAKAWNCPQGMFAPS